jgi:hypothetical protein
MPVKRWPLFPVALAGSTYFVLSEGYALAGYPEPVEEYIQYCREHGGFRTASLAAPTRARALSDLEEMRRSAAWKAIRWQDRGQGFSYSFDEGWVWEFIRKQAEVRG